MIFTFILSLAITVELISSTPLTAEPTRMPSPYPTESPTPLPSQLPTFAPTDYPTASPVLSTPSPTDAPLESTTTIAFTASLDNNLSRETQSETANEVYFYLIVFAAIFMCILFIVTFITGMWRVHKAEKREDEIEVQLPSSPRTRSTRRHGNSRRQSLLKNAQYGNLQLKHTMTKYGYIDPPLGNKALPDDRNRYVTPLAARHDAAAITKNNNDYDTVKDQFLSGSAYDAVEMQLE